MEQVELTYIEAFNTELYNSFYHMDEDMISVYLQRVKS